MITSIIFMKNGDFYGETYKYRSHYEEPIWGIMIAFFTYIFRHK